MGEGAHLKIKIQIYCGDEIAMGPGKADLLDAIAAEGSISGAGRRLGMSYRRTWLLVDVMNRCWRDPLVETLAGGRQGGGARLTDLGVEVLAKYRAIQGVADGIERGPDWGSLHTILRQSPLSSQGRD